MGIHGIESALKRFVALESIDRISLFEPSKKARVGVLGLPIGSLISKSAVKRLFTLGRIGLRLTTHLLSQLLDLPLEGGSLSRKLRRLFSCTASDKVNHVLAVRFRISFGNVGFRLFVSSDFTSQTVVLLHQLLDARLKVLRLLMQARNFRVVLALQRRITIAKLLDVVGFNLIFWLVVPHRLGNLRVRVLNRLFQNLCVVRRLLDGRRQCHVLFSLAPTLRSAFVALGHGFQNVPDGLALALHAINHGHVRARLQGFSSLHQEFFEKLNHRLEFLGSESVKARPKAGFLLRSFEVKPTAYSILTFIHSLYSSLLSIHLIGQFCSLRIDLRAPIFKSALVRLIVGGSRAPTGLRLALHLLHLCHLHLLHLH
nr:MAG TPA: hypothetical protein [Caudoviricetes sp.]